MTNYYATFTLDDGQIFSSSLRFESIDETIWYARSIKNGNSNIIDFNWEVNISD